MTYCGEHSLVNAYRDGAVAVSLRCRSWLCDDCYERRRNQLIAEAIAGKPNTFLTLTIRRSRARSPEHAVALLADAWRKLRRKIAAEHNGKLAPFLLIVERHLSGWPHFHILCRMPYIDQSLLSAWMQEILDSPILWIERLRSQRGAAKYAAKYCGKCTQKIGTKKRYWKSRDYPLEPGQAGLPALEVNGPWFIDQRSLQDIVNVWQRSGLIVEWLGPNKALSSRPPAHGPP